MKKKLAIVIPSLRGGGAERVVINLVRKFDRSKFDISLILIKEEGAYVKLIPEDVRVIDLDSNRVRYSIFKLVKELNKYRPDVILSTLGHLNLALLSVKFLLKGSPKIIVREANTPSKSMSKLDKNKKNLFSYMYRLLYPKAYLIISQCKDMKEDIINCFGIRDKKIKYIYNPLDIEKIRDNMKDKNPYNPSKINLISVGRLSYQKGFDVLIDAFKIVNEKFPRTHLTILGEGELKEELQEQVEKLGISKEISIVEFKENPYPYYYYADTYILSSRWEGFPNTLLEALACGTKVVATNCKSGPREIIEDDKFGILVQDEDSEDLAKGIIDSINGENKTGCRAEFFRVDKIVREYEEILLS